MNSGGYIKLTDLAAVLGGLALTYYGVGYVLDKFPLRIGKLNVPPGPVLPPAPFGVPANTPPKPRLMTESPLRLTPGVRYGVALDTPSAFGVRIASDSMIRGAAADLGFTNVDVFSKPPAGWPGDTTGKTTADTWVVALYSGQPKSLPRSQSGVDVIEAFEG